MLTWGQTNLAYGIIWEIANGGDYPGVDTWAHDWLESLDPVLREQLETARRFRNL